MNDDKLEKLLKEADCSADAPVAVSVSLSDLRRRAGRRRVALVAMPTVAAVVIAACIFSLMPGKPKADVEQDRIAAIEDRIKQLQASTDATLNLIREVLADEREQRRLDRLEAELASIPDPVEEIQKQVDKTAFILLYQADRLYRELNQTESAVDAYNRLIELFPNNRWARVARQRLDEIQKAKPQKTSFEGDTLWKPQNS
ncbi:MAG: hypothetical protein JSU94_03560 [Phycisphaerales bacterium]|nr:MAG: hypothetical protein JSU94_03560 [Phycisphaerales bacterium]